jgi:hypothetical protein
VTTPSDHQSSANEFSFFSTNTKSDTSDQKSRSQRTEIAESEHKTSESGRSTTSDEKPASHRTATTASICTIDSANDWNDNSDRSDFADDSEESEKESEKESENENENELSDDFLDDEPEIDIEIEIHPPAAETRRVSPGYFRRLRRTPVPPHLVSDVSPPRTPPHLPASPSPTSVRYAHLRSACAPQPLSAPEADPEPPHRPEIPPRVRARIAIAIAMAMAMAMGSLKGISSEVLEAALFELQERRREVTNAHRFEESSKCQHAINHVIATHLTQTKREVQNAALEQHRIAAKELEKAAGNFDRNTNELMRGLMELQAERRRDLVETHKNEIRKHKKQWNSRRMVRMYNRPSQNVRALRERRTWLAVQCRFDEADDAHKVSNKETQSAERDRGNSRQNDYKVSLEQLKAKQSGELALFDENAVIEIARLRHDRVMMRKAIDNKGKKIEMEGEFLKDVERVWNAKRVQRFQQITQGIAECWSFGHLKREEVGKSDGAVLVLPPLRSGSRNPS